MPDKVVIMFLVVDALFAASAGLLLAMVFITRARKERPRTTDNVASEMLLMNTPLDGKAGSPYSSSGVFNLSQLLKTRCCSIGTIFNAALILLTFMVSLPGLILPRNRTWFTVHGWLVMLCGITTLVLGLDIWFKTLQTRSNVGDIWRGQADADLSLIQRKVKVLTQQSVILFGGERKQNLTIYRKIQQFNCCGYLDNSAQFKPDLTCPTASIAAQKIGCVGPFSNYANPFLDVVFTAMFGFVGTLFFPFPFLSSLSFLSLLPFPIHPSQLLTKTT